MKVPIAWLRDFVDLPADSQAVADRLAEIGFPVDEIIKRPALSGIVIGRIATLDRHPNADRLLVAAVEIGNGRRLNIATAATNVAVDQTIGVATIGAQLPNLRIERRKMRGVESEGMMISADELGLPAEWFEDGILQVNGDARLGDDVVQWLQLSDDVLDVDVTTNRPDAMCVFGLARELAAAYRTSLRSPAGMQQVLPAGSDPDGVNVVLKSRDCTRFIAQRFTGVRIGPSPLSMRVRLALAGQRPINNVVDISNYVMLEVGQPLHFYDAGRITGNQLIARDAEPGETLTTLDGAQYKLSPLDLVIADKAGAQGLAGLKGGQNTEVTDSTSAVVLEAANFTGRRVRRMRAALGLRTEASARHEKGLAPILTDFGATRAATLLSAEGATAHPALIFGDPLEPLPPVHFAVSDVKRLLGFELPAQQIESHLEDLGFAVRSKSKDVLDVTPPLWRRDVTVAADIVEEIARMAGYANVPAEFPQLVPHDISSDQYVLEASAAESLAALGYHEIISYSLHGSRAQEKFAQASLEAPPLAEVCNPLSEDQRYLRRSLEAGFLEYFSRVREPINVFEIGHVFEPAAPVDEDAIAGFAFTAKALDEPPWRDTHFLEIKGHGEALIRRLCGRDPQAQSFELRGFHPGKTAVLSLDDRRVAYIGAIDPRLTRAYGIDLQVYAGAIELRNLPPKATPQFIAPSRFPTTQRDLALVLPLDVSAASLQTAITAAAGSVCKGVHVFDEYRGPQVPPDHKSLAARLTLGRDDATMTDAQADEIVGKVLESLHTRFGATIRT
ncbi:MAG: phenylalanine--tRNA ligase subunit beta [Candidatus Eremiobacteraeota bacterium]|nr:phenylalanine--tRNA ligase subunit beta [Candidatus Eremiobacteraeota bacterium]